MVFSKAITLLSLAGSIVASPCPYGQLAERGQLSEKDASNFYAARSEGEVFTESQLKTREIETRAEHARQLDFYKRQVSTGSLPLGGGLVAGVLQPFSGTLEGLDVPVPQPTGLAIIPDKAHPYQAPGKTDVRGMW
nr:hypothetical protein CFP56_07428 [Quercus suber]